MSDKLNLIKNINILSQLSDEELNIFSEYCEFRNFSKDAVIFKAGEESRSLFIVNSGEIRIVNKISEYDENVLAYFNKPGEIFGEFDLFENDKRSANAIANKDSRLLVFPGQDIRFDDVNKEHPDIFVKICHKLITINAGRIRQTNRLVSEKNEWIEELKNQMLVDKLTGFYNKTYLEDELPKILKQHDTISIAAVKPDDFKSVNDNFGHEAGDAALKAIADAFRSCLGENELPIRYRGNECLVIYPDTGLEEGIEKAKKLHSVLGSVDIGKLIGDRSLFLTFSIGLSNYPEHTDNRDELIDLAYTRLFEKRESGGNGILVVEKGEEDNIYFFKTVSAFSSLTIPELKKVSKYLKLTVIKKDGILCSEGDDGKEMFIIQSGSAGVRIKLADGSEKEITEFSSGDFFGEMTIFENEKRSATCAAKEDSRIFILHKNNFFSIMENTPDIALKIMRKILDIISSRVSNTNRFVSELVKWGEEASRRAVTDELTGLYNRRYLDSSLEELFKLAKNENRPLCLIMADMDYFREVNEGYSHEIGDKYIVEVAKIFKKCLRETDIIARFGGDEFTMALPDTNAGQVREIAENIRLNVEELDFLKEYEGPELKLSVSLGVAVFPDHCYELNELKELADKALYKAKNSGRNRVVLC